MNLTRLIPFFVLVVAKCHSAFAKDLEEIPKATKAPKATKSPKAANPSKASPSVSPKVKKAPKANFSPSEKPSVLPSNEPSLSPSEKPSVLPSNEPSLSPSEKPSVFPSLSPTIDCDVTNFDELQGAINSGAYDIKLCSRIFLFTKEIDLSGKSFTFTCPNGGCVLDAESNDRFFYLSGERNSFDGITFKNGYSGNGGAIYISVGEVVITGSTFEGNTAPFYYGGAIYNRSGSAVITGSNFVGNTAGRGGGAISNFAAPAVPAVITVTGSTFEGNTAGGEGGAIRNNRGTANIAESEFIGNTAGGEGGAISNRGGSMDITGSEFEGNTATNYGNNIISDRDVTCTDDMNTFESSGGSGNDGLSGNYPVGLCAL